VHGLIKPSLSLSLITEKVSSAEKVNQPVDVEGGVVVEDM
jgi:hypothetical protein